MKSAISDKKFLTTMLLCLFFSTWGMHRFYVGKRGTGILMVMTLGGVFIWSLIDLIMIATGSFTDIEGRVIAYKNPNPEAKAKKKAKKPIKKATSRVPKDYDQPLYTKKMIWNSIRAIAFIGLPIAFFMSWVNISWLTFFLIMIGIPFSGFVFDALFDKYDSWDKRSKESFFKKYNIKRT